MISEGSYDTEDWSVGFWKFTFAIKGWNKHFIYIKTENCFIFCLLSRIVKSYWYWCCINSWYVDIETILVTNKWVIRLSCKPPKHQFQMVPPPVNSVPDVELWYREVIPAQCQAPATLTTDRAEPRPAPDWHAENGPAGYWLQPSLALKLVTVPNCHH